MKAQEVIMAVAFGSGISGMIAYSFGYWIGLRKGHREAISHYRKRMARSQTDVDRFSHLLGLDDARPILRSAVIKPTASRRSQAGLDEDSR